ncbi:MAG: serine acetyltransferase [Breznakibacter sp.]
MGVNTEKAFSLLVDQIHAGLCFMCSAEEQNNYVEQKTKAFEKATKFIQGLPQMRKILSTDVEAAYIGDPAAQSRGEVIFCYPAIRAIANYRIAHALLKLDVPLIPRMISEMAHSETGIDIHPNAQIGESFTIDHGTGVVIGATSIIGKNVKLFQGVTLGAKNFKLDEKGNPIKGIPRHPIVEDNVVIYAQATILGRITVGEGSVIGGNVWVTSDVPPGSKIVQFKPKDPYFYDGSGI